MAIIHLDIGEGPRLKAVMPFLSQPQNGYRYATDAVILGAFAAQKMTKAWADLGTGCGVLAVRLARAWPQSKGLAIERDRTAMVYARQNLATYSVTMVHGDIRTFPWRSSSLDLLVCNPPFFDPNAFRQSQNLHIRAARHALFGDVVSFAKSLKPALTNSGRLCFVFPLALVEAKLNGILALGYFLQRRLEFQSFVDRKAHGVCLEFGQTKVPVTQTRLVLYHSPGFYTQEAWRFLAPS